MGSISLNGVEKWFGDLQVINVNGHQADECPWSIVSEIELIVNATLMYTAIIREDSDELDLKRSWCIG